MLDGTKVATVLFDLLLHIRLKIRKPRIRIHRDLDLSVLNRFEPSFPSNVVFLLYGLVEEVLGRIAEARDSVQSPDRLPRGVQSIQTRSEERRVGKECRTRWAPCR